MKCQQLQLRNFVRFSCKKSALVFTLIKHVSVLFFFSGSLRYMGTMACPLDTVHINGVPLQNRVQFCQQ